ncbi:hypothetical protein ECE50_029445 [Chitinophaga sp. Mgbs1]|uniref:Uncharacterized protein n=1 Tax=Chitinophaga solisilvae TaxID=1233460 RepID=A0A433WPY6_9BACT|nr:hypothetical protein [Chitinophaga solisilvae]
MNTHHLSEEALQQAAMEQPEAGSVREAHLEGCPSCRAAVAEYRAIFGALKTMEKPVFDFDVAQLVLEQLPQPQPAVRRFPWPVVLTGAAAVMGFAVPLLVLGRFLSSLFSGIPAMMLALIGVTAAGILLFLCRETVLNYREKMRLLNFY